jgi:hypothetical protein
MHYLWVALVLPAAATIFFERSRAHRADPSDVGAGVAAIVSMLLALAAAWWSLRPEGTYVVAAIAVAFAGAAYVEADRWDNVAEKTDATRRATGIYAGAVTAAMTMAFAIATPGWLFAAAMGLVILTTALFAILDKIDVLRWAVPAVAVFAGLALQINAALSCGGGWLCLLPGLAVIAAGGILISARRDVPAIAAIAIGVALKIVSR